jgi:hypothetical protein
MSESKEVRTTSATGGQKGVKLERMDLIPVEPLLELARVYGKGAEKYDDNNYRRGYEWSKSYGALLRHITAFWAGEDNDPEFGTSHLMHAAWHCFTLFTFIEEHPEYDNRYNTVRALREANDYKKIAQEMKFQLEEETSIEDGVILADIPATLTKSDLVTLPPDWINEEL